MVPPVFAILKKVIYLRMTLSTRLRANPGPFTMVGKHPCRGSLLVFEHSDADETKILIASQLRQLSGRIFWALISTLPVQNKFLALYLTQKACQGYSRSRRCGNKMTSRIFGVSVSSITRRSIPIPNPPFGGIP